MIGHSWLRGPIIRSWLSRQTILDDLDGSANAKEVSFSLDSRTWTIDLALRTAQHWRRRSSPTLLRGPNRAARRSKSTRSSARSKSRADMGAVREWAKSNGHQVSDRGRISADVQTAYDAAH